MVNEHRFPRASAVFLLAAALAFIAGSSGLAAPGPGDTSIGGILGLGNTGDPARERTLDAFSREIEAGVGDLRLHYMKGGDWPPPPAVAIDFLLLRAAVTKKQALNDLALGTAAVYASMHVNDFINSGHDVGGSVFEKRAIDEAGILSMLSVAWRASGKDAFRTAAIRIGDDLAGWATPSAKGGEGNIQITVPDSLAGRPAAWHKPPVVPMRSKTAVAGGLTRFVFGPSSPEEPERIAAALLEAGVVFGRPEWLKAARTIPMTSRIRESRIGVNGDPATARRLLAAIDASPGRPHKSWLKAAPFWAGQLTGESGSTTVAAGLWKAPVNPVAGGWAALALMQYGASAHDDSARALAARIVDRIAPPGAKPENRNPDLFAAQAAAAFALQLYLQPAPMAYIVADPRSAVTDSLVAAAVRANRPGRIVSVHSPRETDLLYPADSDGKPIAYVCSGELCAPPADVPADVKALVETFALPEAAGETPGVGRSPE